MRTVAKTWSGVGMAVALSVLALMLGACVEKTVSRTRWGTGDTFRKEPTPSGSPDYRMESPKLGSPRP